MTRSNRINNARRAEIAREGPRGVCLIQAMPRRRLRQSREGQKGLRRRGRANESFRTWSQFRSCNLHIDTRRSILHFGLLEALTYLSLVLLPDSTVSEIFRRYTYMLSLYLLLENFVRLPILLRSLAPSFSRWSLGGNLQTR